MQKILHTPEGVRDLYSRECEQKRLLQERILTVIRSFGYHGIETPTFEYFDVFGADIGTTPSKDLYKFFDREGNTLALRPDFTPSVARAAAKYFLPANEPVRLTYLGNTFVNSSEYRGRMKENTNLGAELIGDGSVDADAEVIALVIRSLLAAGLENFQISIGHAGYFKALAEAADLEPQEVDELRRLCSNKNTFGVEKLLSATAGRGNMEATEALKKLPRMFGGVEILQEAAVSCTNPDAVQALNRLRDIYEILKFYHVERYVSFDLGMLNGYSYYTGIVFRGYTFGTGDTIVKGGRYDHLLGYFGKEAPAVGFVRVTDQLLLALMRQKIELEPGQERRIIRYQDATRKEAIEEAEALRAEGYAVELIHEAEDTYGPDEQK